MIDYSFSFIDLEYFLLILSRVASFLFLCPFFSIRNTPRRFRAAFAIVVSILLYQSMAEQGNTLEFGTLLEYSLVVIKESIVGLLLGLSTQLCLSIMDFAGHLADMETGLTMVQALDPTTNQMASITGNLYTYAFTMIMLANGLYRYFLGAIADTFTLIPIAGAQINLAGITASMIKFMGEYVVIAFRIILPIFASILMLNAILGVMAKVAPQLHIFSIGVQMKIIIGLGVLFLSFGMIGTISDFIYSEMKTMFTSFVEAML